MKAGWRLAAVIVGTAAVASATPGKDRPPQPAGVHDERWWVEYRATARAAINQHAHDALQQPVPMP